jgi:hypothetical protein
LKKEWGIAFNVLFYQEKTVLSRPGGIHRAGERPFADAALT